MDFPSTKSKLMTMLPQEILRDILTLLPIKLIGSCRCVSKTWQKLLSERDFIRAHLDRTKHLPENELLVLGSFQSNTLYTASIECQLPSEFTFSATELAFFEKPQPVWEEYPSCDGLIVMGDIVKSSLLVNLTTKEVRELPVPQHALNTYERFAVHGLGYDYVNDDYKVVSPSFYHISYAVEPVMVVHVYSVRNGTWKEVDSALYEPCDVRKGTWKKVENFEYHFGYGTCYTGVFVGGSIHWLATNIPNHSSFIVGFNLAEEKMRIIPAPKSIYEKDFRSQTVGELGGCLCVLNLTSGKETNIWVMKEYGVMQSWLKLSIGDNVSNYLPYFCVPGRREVVMWKDVETKDMEMVTYNVDSATFKSITIHGVAHAYFGGIFRETLVSPYYNYDTRSLRS